MPVHITDFLEIGSNGIKKEDLIKSPNLKIFFDYN